MVNYNTGNVGVAVLTGTPSAGQIPVATSGTAAIWEAPPFVTGQSAGTGGAGAITSTTLTDIGPTFTVPTGGAPVGSMFVLVAYVNLTATGSTGVDNIIIAPYYGGVAGTQLVNLNPLNTSGPPNIVGQVGFIKIQAEVLFTSATATTTIITAVTYTSSGNGTIVDGRGGTFGQTGLTAGGNQVLTFGWQFQQNTGAPSVTPVLAYGYRVV
jgi:hypothetical protein